MIQHCISTYIIQVIPFCKYTQNATSVAHRCYLPFYISMSRWIPTCSVLDSSP